MSRFSRNQIAEFSAWAALAVGLIAIDQIVKQLAIAFLENKPSVGFLGELIVLQFVRNSGAFLSFGSDLPPFLWWLLLVIIPIAMTFGVIYWTVRNKSRDTYYKILACVFVAGGLGNLIDRILYQSVVDFLNFGIGPARTGIMNVADLYIAACVVMIVIKIFTEKEETPAQELTHIAEHALHPALETVPPEGSQHLVADGSTVAKASTKHVESSRPASARRKEPSSLAEKKPSSESAVANKSVSASSTARKKPVGKASSGGSDRTAAKRAPSKAASSSRSTAHEKAAAATSGKASASKAGTKAVAKRTGEPSKAKATVAKSGATKPASMQNDKKTSVAMKKTTAKAPAKAEASVRASEANKTTAKAKAPAKGEASRTSRTSKAPAEKAPASRTSAKKATTAKTAPAGASKPARKAPTAAKPRVAASKTKDSTSKTGKKS